MNFRHLSSCGTIRATIRYIKILKDSRHDFSYLLHDLSAKGWITHDSMGRTNIDDIVLVDDYCYQF